MCTGVQIGSTERCIPSRTTKQGKTKGEKTVGEEEERRDGHRNTSIRAQGLREIRQSEQTDKTDMRLGIHLFLSDNNACRSPHRVYANNVFGE
jgi:hypothetical protein